jgi:Circadian oscillating protein COP23
MIVSSPNAKGLIMRLFLFSRRAIYLWISLYSSIALFANPSYAENTKFRCEMRNDIPFTVAQTPRGKEPIIRWVVKDFRKSGYTPQRRCQEFSTVMQRYYDNGPFYFTSKENINGRPVLCITADKKESTCNSNNILVVLKSGTNAGKTLKLMLNFRRGSSAKPLELSGSKLVSYDADGNFYLNMREMIDEFSNNEQAPDTNTSQPSLPSSNH